MDIFFFFFFIYVTTCRLLQKKIVLKKKKYTLFSLQTHHPLYRPSNDLVSCKDPLCASLHPPGAQRCDDAGQCDYEVEYADGGSSLGVLVRDAFSLNFSSGTQQKPRLALGLVTLSFCYWILFPLS